MAIRSFKELTDKMSPERRAAAEASAKRASIAIELYGEHLEYRGYRGSIEDSPEDGVLHGKLMGIRDLVSYDGADLDTLETNFHGAVDEYIAFCKAEGKPLPSPICVTQMH